MSKTPKIHVKVGDRIRWSYLGQTGDTGVVLKVLPRGKPGQRKVGSGGVRAMVEVRWDSNKVVGRIEDRKLALVVEEKACRHSHPETVCDGQEHETSCGDCGAHLTAGPCPEA